MNRYIMKTWSFLDRQNNLATNLLYEEYKLMKSKTKMKSRKTIKRVMSIIVVLIVILTIAGKIGWSMLKKEHNEILSMSFANVDFNKLDDGTYEGYFKGGMYKWRENRIQVIINSGKVTSVKVLEHSEGVSEELTNELFERVIKAQLFGVDTISGATLTSKAYLKGFEDALLKAQE